MLPHISVTMAVDSKKSSSDIHVSNPFYLAVLKRRRTGEYAELLVKQGEERTQRKLKLL